MTIGNTQDEPTATAAEPAGARLPYVAPFIRVLDMADSGGKEVTSIEFASSRTFGVS